MAFHGKWIAVIPASLAALSACMPTGEGQSAPTAEGELLCLYTQSNHGSLLDFKTPDVVYWGAITPWSEVNDNGGTVERLPSNNPNVVGRLVVRARELKQGGRTPDTYYTVVRNGASELRLHMEPSNYDPDEVGTDPYPLCQAYSEGN